MSATSMATRLPNRKRISSPSWKTPTTGKCFPGAHNAATNAVTGARVNVDPIIGALIEFVQVAYRNYERDGTGKMTVNGKNVAIGTFDRVRHTVLRLDRNAYYAILD